MKKFFLAAILAGFFIEGVWLVAVPSGLIQGIIENSGGAERDFYLKTVGLRKGFFFNISAERILLNKRKTSDSDEKLLLALSGIKARIDPLSVLRLSPEADFSCDLNNGRVVGKFGFLSKKVNLEGQGISIKDLPFLQMSGVQGSGALKVSLWFEGAKGEIKFSSDDLKLGGASFSSDVFRGFGVVRGIVLPLDLFYGMKGDVSVRDGSIDVKSLALEGEGIYARLRGGANGGRVNMDLELMTDSSFKSEPLVRMMLGRYKISPGYYLVPLRS